MLIDMLILKNITILKRFQLEKYEDLKNAQFSKENLYEWK